MQQSNRMLGAIFDDPVELSPNTTIISWNIDGWPGFETLGAIRAPALSNAPANADVTISGQDIARSTDALLGTTAVAVKNGCN